MSSKGRKGNGSTNLPSHLHVSQCLVWRTLSHYSYVLDTLSALYSMDIHVSFSPK